MRHEEARRHLTALAAGELEEPLRSTVEAHAADCPDCRGWRQTHRAVKRAVAGGADPSHHPSSAELAAWALDPEGPAAADLAHLESCAGCREDLELGRRAVLEARAAAGMEPPAAGRGGSRRRRARLAIAAACVGAVLVGGLLLRSPSPPRAAYRMSNETLTGSRLIAAESSIRADAVEIAQGSNITFEAGDSIALGDGFVVANGATFAAGTSSSKESSSDGT